MGTTRSRRTRAELRELLLAAGREILVDLDPTIGFEQLSYSRVFTRLQDKQGVRVTHASVHERIWPSQQAFQFDVLRSGLEELNDRWSASHDEPMLAVAAAADLDSLEGRRQAAAELCRVGQNANWEALVDSDGTRLLTMIELHATLGAGRNKDQEFENIRKFGDEQQELSLARYRATLEGVASFLNVRTRPDLGDQTAAIEQLARTLDRLALSFLLDGARPRHDLIALPTGPVGEERLWRPISLAAWTCCRGSFEFADEGLEPGERVI